jgi:hypothetical protein
MRGSWPIEFPSIESSKHNKPIYSYPFTLFSNLHVVHPLIHDQGWRPRLAGQPRATRRRPCPGGVPTGRELRRFLCQFAWKLASSLYASMLVILWWFACKPLRSSPWRVTSSLGSLVRGGPGVQCPCWCVIHTTFDVNTMSSTISYS